MIGKTWLWWQIWMTLKPNLKCTKFAQYKAEYEQKIAIAEANIDQAVADCNKVKEAHAALSTDKDEVLRALDSGGDVVKELKTLIMEEYSMTTFPSYHLNVEEAYPGNNDGNLVTGWC